MQVLHKSLRVQTKGRGLTPITEPIQQWLGSEGVGEGLCTVFIQHTSASLLIQENADPSARRDLERWLSRLVQDGDPLFTHTAEGPDDMPSHVRAALTQTQLSIPVIGGDLQLGTWQGIYVWEHRHAPHLRNVLVQYLGAR